MHGFEGGCESGQLIAKRADCKTRAPDISCGQLDSSLLGAQRPPC